MTEPHESDGDRSITWRVATLSAVSALLGAVIGGLFAYLVAIKQVDSQARQAQADFLTSAFHV